MNRSEGTSATGQIRLERRLPSYWRVTFDIPPLNTFVDAMAMRIASFDKLAIAETKRLVDAASLPSDADIRPEWEAFLAALNRPASQKRIKALMERGFHRPGDVENRLGFYVGQIGG